MEGMKAHTFHIPVLGLAFSVDTPIRVARFGISSVISIVDDILIERMRKHYSNLYGQPYTAISDREEDSRAKRITAYLNLVHQTVQRQMAELKASTFESGGELAKYFEMLADHSPLKSLYRRMNRTGSDEERLRLQEELRSSVVAGSIDVNIMTKLDKVNSRRNGEELPPEQSDAVAALRGFVRSDLQSAVVLSAGMNPRLYGYLSKCTEFLPDGTHPPTKKIILKVSDYRSAIIQGKYLAKRGIWISEFRIESGLNCGGHAFPTEGLLLGPILEEFKAKRSELVRELYGLYCAGLRDRGMTPPHTPLPVTVTVQGGIGTAREDAFLRENFAVDGTGWGSPFLLVPEATRVDDETRQRLAKAAAGDFYISGASPLGVPFNNFRNSSSEEQRLRRIADGRPGSPCTKKYLIANTEFTEKPICTASRQYQALKLAQVQSSGLPEEDLQKRVAEVVEKTCLCEDLAGAGPVDAESGEERPPVAVCPGPNLAYFSRIVSLQDMVGHIYGRVQLLSNRDRSNMFINELRLYVEYLRNHIAVKLETLSAKEQSYARTFRANLLAGIEYYRSMIPRLVEETGEYREMMRGELLELEEQLLGIFVPSPELQETV